MKEPRKAYNSHVPEGKKTVQVRISKDLEDFIEEYRRWLEDWNENKYTFAEASFMIVKSLRRALENGLLVDDEDTFRRDFFRRFFSKK